MDGAQYSQHSLLRLLDYCDDVHHDVGVQQHERQRALCHPGTRFDGRVSQRDPLAPVSCRFQDDPLSPVVRLHWTRACLWSDGTFAYHLYARPSGLPALLNTKREPVLEGLKDGNATKIQRAETMIPGSGKR